MQDFSDKIIKWYSFNKRDLPWRNTKNPYFIWLSEIILQQTRVEQGTEYYLKFIQNFPTVKSLANAKNDKIMKLWQGLGYYSRARNLHNSAQIIIDTYKGKFPSTFEEILSLKGVGNYTAAAIASFAYNLPHAVVDGNVYRVLSRIFGIYTPIDSTKGQKEYLKLANQLMDKKNPALFNQAIMEFGALQCKPSNPNCENCPLNSKCFAFSKNMVADFPIKEKKTKVRNRYFNYLVLNYKGKTLINKRTQKDIWTNLYDFPLIETKIKISETQLLKSKHWKELISNNDFIVTKISKEYKHILSHQKIYARFWEINLKSNFNKNLLNKYISIKRAELKKFAVPRLVDIYLHD